MTTEEYITAGDAIFTLMSTLIDRRTTYRITQDKNQPKRYFCKYLYGPENTRDYRYIGMFYSDTLHLRTTRASDMTNRNLTFAMMSYFLDVVAGRREWPDTMQFYKSNRCARCARLLTTPESIEKGIGPECATYIS